MPNCNACTEPYHCDCKCDTCIKSKLRWELKIYELQFKDFLTPERLNAIVENAFILYKEKHP